MHIELSFKKEVKSHPKGNYATSQVLSVRRIADLYPLEAPIWERETRI
jgi:hypothetical protein